MDSVRILVAMSNELSLNKLKAVLDENGYKVIGHAKDGHDCLRKIINFKPDLAVVDYDLSPQNGFETAQIAIEDRLCDVILMVNNEQKNSIEQMNPQNDFVIVTKPLNRVSFVNTIDMIIKNRKKIMKLEKEIEALRKTLDTRKEIEKAKGLIMERMNLTEEQAFRMIQKQSMDRGIQMKEIAKAIILTYNLKS